ncbi:lipid A export permease/ATP-binding protein MsbA [Gammaproteobacteria bacterium 50_400_T64]|nr:lipid A export permease/ATP-binding protein MsbA [Gammaproteobacteria bacterium 50_400_T64]
MKNKEITAGPSGLQVYLRILGYLKKYWRIFIVSILGLWVFSAVQIAFIDLLGYMINVLTVVTGDSDIPADINMMTMDAGLTSQVAEWLMADGPVLEQSRLVLPTMMIGLALVRGLAFLVGNYGMAYVSQSVVHDLRTEVFAKYTRMPSAYFDGQMAGHMVAQLTFHVNQVMTASTKAIKVVLREGFLVIGLLIYLVYLNWRLALVFLIVMPVIAGIVGFVSKRFRVISKRIQTAVGDVTHVAQEAVSGYREMHLYGGGEYENERMSKASQRNRQQNLKLAIAEGLSTPVVQILLSVALGLLVWTALTPEILGSMSTGGFIKFLFTASLLAKPVRQLTQINSLVQQGITAATTLFETIDGEEEVDQGQFEKERAEGKFSFENVGFRYNEKDDEVLSEINFSVEPGETIALVGSSGSGKTSLVSLIPRFYNYKSGRISLDGHDINDYTLTNLRKHIALVSQQVTLFNDTIYNNIAYGELANCSREAVREATRLAYALDFIEALPEGFETMIGDDGVMLSGGQRQRLAIARALLKDAPVLILDEATSALDTESERAIQAALEVAMKDRTTFVIAHRLSTVENADRILVLEQGRIVEEGSHTALLAANGRYASLYQQQFSDDAT